MLTRKLLTSTTSANPAPAAARMSRMLYSTTRVCSRMSRTIVPIASIEAPAMLLSGRRLLMPAVNRKGPARLTCE